MNRQLLICLSILIAFDVSFIALYLLDQLYGLATDSRWEIESDHSYAEMFSYMKLMSVVALLIATFGHSKEQIYLMWAGLFAYERYACASLYRLRRGLPGRGDDPAARAVQS